METLAVKEQSKSVLKKSKDEFIIIDNYNRFIGKLTILLENGTKAMFDDGINKFIFEKTGFWKNNLKVRYFNNLSVLYETTLSWKNSTSAIAFSDNIPVVMKQPDIFKNYWEWQVQSTKKPLIGYSVIPDFENLLSVNLFTKDVLHNELNLMYAIGYFILLKF